jgi:hypothetical protein
MRLFKAAEMTEIYKRREGTETTKTLRRTIEEIV